MKARYITSEDAAALLCYASIRTLHHAIATGVKNGRGERIPFLRRGRTFLFDVDALHAWLTPDEAGGRRNDPAALKLAR